MNPKGLQYLSDVDPIDQTKVFESSMIKKAIEWSFTINYFLFISYINVSSKQIKGTDTELNMENTQYL